MRDDLDFLYQKAMCSQDIEFMEEVYMLLSDADRYDDLDNLDGRISDIKVHTRNEYTYFIYTPTQDKFDFLVGDSQMGKNWYRNR